VSHNPGLPAGRARSESGGRGAEEAGGEPPGRG
jgi:hypothetical protein